MNENIDLTKILKDCPKGWEMYSSVYGKVTFSSIEYNVDYPIKFLFIKNNEEIWGSVTKEGIHNNSYNGECTLFPSENQRDWSKFTAPWYNKEKFNPKTLQPFDRVIARDANDHDWKCDIFSHSKSSDVCPYKCAGYGYVHCIPYNDDTKHLVGTTNEAPEYYRYWED